MTCWLRRYRRCLLIAALAALCFASRDFPAWGQYLWNGNPPDEPRSVEPDTDGVTPSGAATYSVPIVVPQARGPVPNLALLYNSQSGNGVAGMGWTISGIPAIARSRGDVGVTFTATDNYSYLPGGWGSTAGPDNLLVAKNADRYHLARNIADAPFMEFQAVGSGCGSGPCYFIGRDGQGNTYYFGGDEHHIAATGSIDQALWEPDNGATRARGIVAWSLYRMVDADGNYYRVDYANDGQTLYPSEIHYNLPMAENGGRSLAVEFLYEPRNDTTPMPGHFTKRLYRVNVFANCPGVILNCSLLHRYELGYTTSLYAGNPESPGSSLLTSITEYGSNSLAHGPPGDTSGGGLPPRTFTYTTSGGVAASTKDQTNAFDYLEYQWPDDNKWQSHVGDIDGDGRADLVRVHLGKGGQKVQYTCGAKDNSGFTGPVKTQLSGSAPNQPEGLSILADVNGDGKLDLVIAYPNASNHSMSIYVALGAADCSFAPWSNEIVTRFGPGEPFSDDISKWRLLAADINGDGRADLVLYDDGSDAASRRLYWALSQSSGNSVAFDAFNASSWQPLPGGSFPPDHTFNGIIVADLNGDGYSDVLASWSGAPSYPISQEGQLTVMTAYGSAGGLGRPAEYSERGSVRWPFLALRSGDINGDGLPDILLNFQGRTDPNGGVSNGRDLRNRLSTTSTGANPFQIAGQDQYIYPYASTFDSQPHLNNWEFLTADINGDGIDDFVEFYCGYSGRILDYGLGTPTGMALANGFRLIGHPISDTTKGYPDSPTRVWRWLSALGDLDGDGRADFIFAQYGAGGQANTVSFILGTTGGLAPGLNLMAPSPGIASRDSHYLSMRVADINADGRADIILIDDNGDETASTRVTYALSPDPVADAGIPYLLKTINNGAGGTTTLSYILSREYDAVRPDLPGPGHPNTRPRALVSAIMHDNSAGFADGKRYGYVNGRMLSGRPSQRADLGFEQIREYSYIGTDIGSLADLNRTLLPKKHDTFYHQDKPYQGLVSRIEERMIDGTPLWIESNAYASAKPSPNITNVAPQTVQVDTYEGGNLVRSSTVARTWNLANLTLSQTVDHVILPAFDNDIVTDTWYAPDDPGNWIVGKPLGYARYRLSFTVGSVSLLDKEQMTYDAANPLRVATRQSLLLTSSTALCTRTVTNPASLCDAEAAAGYGTWVTTFQNPRYDAYGNLSYAERTYTGTPQQIHKHELTLTYDADYQGLVATRTNALGQVTKIGNDAAFRFLSVTDANGNISIIQYDAYGRPIAVNRPGTSSIVNTSWDYMGLTGKGYLIRKKAYSAAAATQPPLPGPVPIPQPGGPPGPPPVPPGPLPGPPPASPPAPHVVDIYLDGFDQVVGTIDHSAAGDINRWVQRLFDQPTGQLVTRATLPYLPGGTTKYLETRFDLRGRPVARNRLDSAGVVERQLGIYAYNQDGSITVTDADGHATRTSFNQRNQIAARVDAAGNTTIYGYDNTMKLVQVTLPPGQTGNVVGWGYDSWGRKTSENDPATGYTAYEYDAVGNLIRLTRRVSDSGPVTGQIQYSYDGLERPLTESDGGPALITYRYDESAQTNPVGRLTSVTDLSGSTKLGYDPRGNLSRREITLNGLPGSYVYIYGYNDQDQLTQKNFPAGSSDQATQTFLYTDDGLLSEVQHNGQSYASYSRYNAFKQPGLRSSYEQISPVCHVAGACPYANYTQYSYDADQRLQELTVTRSVGVGPSPPVLLFDELYRYDAVGNLSSITDQRQNHLVNGVETDRSQNFGYDALDRLTSACNHLSLTTIGNCQTYFYDALGNLVLDGDLPLTYGTSGTVKTIAAGSGASTLWTAYADSEGKRTHFDDNSMTPATSFTYTFDQWQRLKRVAANGTDIEIYEYNFIGERTKKIARFSNGSSTTTWFIGPDYQVQSSNANNPPLFAKTWRVGDVALLTGGDVINGQTTAQTVLANQYRSFAGDMQQGNAQGTWLKHRDHLGSVALATRPTDGTEVSRYWYTPWGSLRRENSLGYDTTSNKFTDKQLEDGSDLVYFQGRYYDPRSKRFITADDRIVPGAGAQGYNRYAYVLDNPLRYVDPSGHLPMWADLVLDISGYFISDDWTLVKAGYGGVKAIKKGVADDKNGIVGEGGWYAKGFPIATDLLKYAGKLIGSNAAPEIELLQVDPQVFGTNAEFGEAVLGFNEEMFSTMLENVALSRLAGTLASSASLLGWAYTDYKIWKEVWTTANAAQAGYRNPSWCLNVPGTAGCGHARDAGAFVEALQGMQLSPELKAAFAAQFQQGSGALVSHPAEVRISSPSAPSGTRSSAGSPGASSGGRGTQPPGAGGNPGEGHNQEPGSPGSDPGPDDPGGGCDPLCIVGHLLGGL